MADDDADDHRSAAPEGRAPIWATWTRNQRLWLGAFVVLLFAVVVPLGSMATHDSSKLIGRGDVVEPGRGRDVVYVHNDDPQTRCTATTSGGESLTLAPFVGANRRESLGSRRNATKYWAVAVLPTDRGPLRISCSSDDTVLWISAPHDNSTLYIFFSVIGAMTVAITVVAVMLRRRRPPNGA